MNFKKLFWHRLFIAFAILAAWGSLVATSGLSLLLVFILIGALAGTFFKEFTAAKTKNWRWFTVQGAAFSLACLAGVLIVPFTAAGLPKGQSPDFIATSNTAIFYGLLAVIIFTLARIGAESYRHFAARSFFKI
jgi:hypothetical protein